MRHRLFSAPLSDALKTTHKVGSVSVRSGDTVRVMRGDKKGVEGKVTRVDRGKYRLFVEGVTREKVDGSAVQIPVHPSKVMITSLNLDDKWRRESLKVEAPKEAEKPTEEPKKERKKPKSRKAPSEKAKTPRKRKPKTSKVEEQGEAESG
jgi:large subunit ribosomal protein L24